MFILMFIGGVVAFALLINHFNNKLRNLSNDFTKKLVLLNNKIDQLEVKLSQPRESLSEERPEEQVSTPVASASNEPEKPTSTGNEPKTPIPQDKPVYVHETIQTQSPTQEDSTSQTQATSSPQKINRITEGINRVFAAIKNYFTKGNTVAKVGVVVLFFGVAFLVKFATDQGLLPIELRLSAVALGGIFLLQFGWRLRSKKPGYALALQGGGVGILFITCFAAFQIYSLIPGILAFSFLVILAGLSILMAVAQNSASLASLGIVGGFLAPILASTGQGSHVALFSYYAILNLIIAGVSYKKAWRILNLLGFGFTYIIATTWGVLKYRPEDFWTTEPFLVIFFLVYVAVPILFAKNVKPKLKGFVDGTLVFGNSVIFFGLQAKLVADIEFGLAYTALVLALFYFALGRWLYSNSNKNYRLIFEAFLSLGVVFATVTIPLAFEGKVTSAVWAIEAAAIYWISLRQNKTLGRLFSTGLILFASLAFMIDSRYSFDQLPILNSYFLGCMLVALGFYICSFLGYFNKDKLFSFERLLVPTFFIFGSLWWIHAGYQQFESHLGFWWMSREDYDPTSMFPARYLTGFSAIYLMAVSLVLSHLGKRLKWSYLTSLSYVSVFFILVHTSRSTLNESHPFAYGGYYVWPLIIASYYLILKVNDQLIGAIRFLRRSGHALVLWILAIVIVAELGWFLYYVGVSGSAWGAAIKGLVPCLLAAGVIVYGQRLAWPTGMYQTSYLKEGVGPLLGFGFIWFLASNWTTPGEASPLPYIPIFNPLELTHLLFMLVLPLWLFRVKKIINLTSKQIGILIGFVYFYWLNGVLARAIHHFADVPFEFNALYASSLVQMSLSIYWSVIGISLMVFATKKNYRWLWISGIALMAIVVGKLFLIDLSRSGTVERIVSFISVGLVLLAVGYFSPIPPKKTENEL